jgi:hypothetical protein
VLNWGVIGIVVEGEPISVGGINVWDHQWRQVESRPIELPHPQYQSQMHPMYVYEIEGSVETVKFAAGEVSANVWAFYSPLGR